MPSAQPHQIEAQEPLYQIVVDENHPIHGRRELRVGPKMNKRYLAPIMEMIGKRIATGVEKASRQPWSNPRLVLCPETIQDPGSPFTREDRQNELVGGYRDAGTTAASSSLILN